MENATTLADDLLVGAEAIARFVYGAADPVAIRRVYHAGAAGHLPVFKLGRLLAARKSKLLGLGEVAQ
jgi:hypothetical protein